jgi:excisionase family DNA binding protein
MDRRTLNITQACELAGVSRRTIYNWMNANKIDWTRTAGGQVRIFADTLWRDKNDKLSFGANNPNHPIHQQRVTT